MFRHRKRRPKRLNREQYLSNDDHVAHNSAHSSDLPGYYYDKVKKKYFKIQDSSNSAMTGAITNETLTKQKNEEKRLQQITSMQRGVNVHAERTQNSTQRHTVQSYQHSIYKLIEMFSNGCQHKRSSAYFKKQCYRTLGKQLCLKGSSDIFPEPHSDVEHMVKWCPKYESDRLLCLWSLKGNLNEKLQMIDIQNIERTHDFTKDGIEAVDIDVRPSGAVVVQVMNNISNMCWASVPNAKHAILYTTNPLMGHTPTPCIALLRCMAGNSLELFRMGEFQLDIKSSHSCAWNTNRNSFSIGSTDSSLVIDVESRRTSQYYTNNNQVYAQAFEPQQGNLLYSGTRRGWIHIHDVRSKSSRYLHKLQHPSMITHIQAHNEQNYMLSSDVTGKICRWDLRQRKVITDYAGRHCTYVHLPFHMDDSNTLITAVDEFGYIYVWDVQSGDLLKTLPPPCPVNDKFSIPSVCYSSSWGKYSEPGLVAGVRDRVYFYG